MKKSNNYWFVAKSYGWGWTPAKWQGWLILLVYLVLMILLIINLGKTPSPNQLYFELIFPVIILNIILIRICYLKGEKPGWRWGKPKTK